MKILVLGITGLIGKTVFEELSLYKDISVFGTLRGVNDKSKNIYQLDYVAGVVNLKNIIYEIRPDFVINCIGITKHLNEGNNPLSCVTVNSLLPHTVANYCQDVNSKLIQVSTDCVFTGKKGNYNELDNPDSVDLYGRSKIMGEVVNENNLTIRTSTIGHENSTNYGLLEWFLEQESSCSGYSNAFFSGLTTIELARAIKEFIFSDRDLNGLYHLGGDAISKYDLLQIISKTYRKEINIIPENNFSINRTLDSALFKKKTGYLPPSWEEMIDNMFHKFKK